jgi:hypothetical protein
LAEVKQTPSVQATPSAAKTTQIEVSSTPAITTESLQPRKVTDPVMRQNIANARREGAFITDDSIVAKPLTVPGHKVVYKNPSLICRMVNRSARQGLSVERHKLAGFRIATPADISFSDGLTPINNQFIDGDLIAMVIDRNRYLGALKHVAVRAQERVSARDTLQKSRKVLRETLNETSAPAELRNKIQPFIPGASEIPGFELDESMSDQSQE